MEYYKTIDENGCVSIGTVSGDGTGNITESEYNELKAMLRNTPSGKVLHDNGGSYNYIDIPEPANPAETLETLSEKYQEAKAKADRLINVRGRVEQLRDAAVLPTTAALYQAILDMIDGVDV